MKVRKRNITRWFSIAMVFLLLFSYGWTGTGNTRANAKSKSNFSRSLHKTNLQPKNKINQDLVKNFKKHDQVTFLIKLKDQVNTKKVAKNALSKKQKKSLTTAKADLMKRSAIVSALRSKSLETQYHVKDFLKKQKKQGNVKKFHSYFIVNMMAVTGTKKVADKLAKMGEIEKVLPNRTRHLIRKPKRVKKAVNTAKKKTQKKRITGDDEDAIEPNIKHIGALQAWSQGIDGSGTVVGSIDTGVQWDHPALKEKYRGYDPDNPNHPNNEMNWYDATAGKDTPYDDNEHGTHTVGTMVGSEPDGSNQIGVAPEAQWIAAKALDSDGNGTDEELLDAGQWMLAPTDKDGNTHPEMAPDVINNSWGGGAGKDEFYRDMVKNWREAGIFPAFAAGNIDDFNPGGPGSVASPGNYPESFAVGATDNDDHLARFSLRGPSPYDEIKPEIAAPGVNIRSSVPGNKYDGSFSGTSMATPAVSGTVALLRQADSSLSVDELEKILMDTAKPLTDKDYPDSPNNGYGHGGLQAGNAVASVISGLGRIKGTVSHMGEDSEPPTYHHKAPDQAFSRKNIPLEIHAKDNAGVKDVNLQYRSSKNDSWQIVKAKRVDGNNKDGVYDATIPADGVKEPSIEYRWKITDYGKNDVTTDIYKVDVKPGITTGYNMDFETTPVGWRSYGFSNTWEWGKPTSGPINAYSGDKVYATTLDGAYPNRVTTATLEMPPIDVPDGGNYLRFKQWYSLPTIDIGGDEIPLAEAYVNISTDQKNWTRLGEFEKDSDDWENGEFRLSKYAGQRVYIAFQLVSLGNTDKPGWYLDDVKLNDTSLHQDTKHNKAMKESKVETPLKKAISEHKKIPEKLKKLNQKLIDLRNMKQDKPKDVKLPLVSHKVSQKNMSGKHVSSLPVNATVSVKETGASTKTDPDDGSYSLMQPVGAYTLEADAYGFHSKSKSVGVNKDKTTFADLTLQEISKGTLDGTITDKQSGDPIKGATVSLTEDAAIKPVRTDKDGHFSMKAYKGDYTMHVSAPDHHSKDTNVTIKGDDATTQDVGLKLFIGTPEKEIGYDDGTAENARAFYDAGNKWGVRMSLPKGRDSAMITGGEFKFSNDQSPDPRDDKFRVEIWDASGKDGAPGKKLAGPVDATAIRDGSKWTTVDLKDLGVEVDGDFYMVYVQLEDADKDVPKAPLLETDEDGPNAHRSWQNARGEWSQSPDDEGNYMIRALVDYDIPAPNISNLKPAKDKHLKTGQSMIISFDSNPGLDTSFKISLPSTNPTDVKTSNVKKFSMMETTPGHYIGVWTANDKTTKGATIEVTAKDDYGNVSTKEADGKLFINVPKPQ